MLTIVTIKLKVRIGNAAFAEAPLGAMLRGFMVEAGDRIEDAASRPPELRNALPLRLQDANGNSVGEVAIAISGWGRTDARRALGLAPLPFTYRRPHDAGK